MHAWLVETWRQPDRASMSNGKPVWRFEFIRFKAISAVIGQLHRL
jgi:hypothetical protein